jgi:hypothetical protein
MNTESWRNGEEDIQKMWGFLEGKKHEFLEN